MNIGHAIKLCRTNKGMSQAQLCALVGCSASHLSLIENNRREPSLSILEEIANHLEVSVVILIFLACENNDLIGINDEIRRSLSRIICDLLKPVEKHNEI